MTVYVGLDVHCKQTTFCAQNDEGRTLAEGSAPTTREGLTHIKRVCRARKGSLVGLETGTQALWVAQVLYDLELAPQVIDAREVRMKARRVGQKSDRRDAFEICDGLRRGIYSTLVYLPPENVERLRRIISRRRHFVRLATSQVNAARFVLRSAGVPRPRTLRTDAAWQRMMDQPDAAPWRAHLLPHHETWHLARLHIERLETELAEAGRPFGRELLLLQSVPGVGPITAATFVATLGTPERFAESACVASYLGLAPSTYNSGERERHGRITKRGSSEARAMLCEAAQKADRPTHPLHPYYARTLARSGRKKAIVAVAQRLSRILYRIWRDGTPFDPARLNVREVRKTKTRMIYYEIGRTPVAAA